MLLNKKNSTNAAISNIVVAVVVDPRSRRSKPSPALFPALAPLTLLSLNSSDVISMEEMIIPIVELTSKAR